MNYQNVTRRKFLVTAVAASGGLAVGFSASSAMAAYANARVSPNINNSPTGKPGQEINAWVEIDPEGIITVRVPHTEQGQGAITSVPMMITEHLEADWNNVRAKFADPNRHVRNDNEYVSMSTAGSNVVRRRHPHIFAAGALARDMLRQAAAEAWGVSMADVTAKNSMLTSGSNSAHFGEFAVAAAGVTLTADPLIKTPEEWTFLGQSIQRQDAAVKVNGSAQYSIDTMLPGMVYASVRNSPVPWGRLTSFDFDAVKDRPGVLAAIELKVFDGVRVDSRGRDRTRHGSSLHSAVAIIADTWYRANTALDLMPVTWDSGPSAAVTGQSIAALLTGALGMPGEVRNEVGDNSQTVIAAAAKTVGGDYSRPYESHVRMEPANATANVTADRCDVWSPCHDQSNALRLAASESGLSTDDTYAHPSWIGGQFGAGGSGNNAVTRQAVALSRDFGAPVKVIWTREEDIMQDQQRSIIHNRFSAAIGSDGLPTALFTRSAGVEARADRAVSDMPYLVPSRRHERHVFDQHIDVGTHRAPGTGQNGFMTESFVDEMAQAGDWDPLDWRIKMTEGLSRWQLVLNKLKEVSGFRTDLPAGMGMGVAVVEDHNSICAACATVSVSRRGQLRIEEFQFVIDNGHMINPLNCTEQAEGSCVYELSHAVTGGLELVDGGFVNTNFDSYQIMRMADAPHVKQIAFALSGGDVWGGMGEPAAPPAPPAVANAVFYATGVRMRTTPFKNYDLSWS
jgi:isoquinoline 1-oxidoreductase beta subunit